MGTRQVLLRSTLLLRVRWMVLTRQAASLHPRMRPLRCCLLRSSLRRQAPGFLRHSVAKRRGSFVANFRPCFGTWGVGRAPGC
ncbi:hypothetical protein PF008_g20454 [Phytophthora fragariae]|uniref:Secreted protein n=1 Tax=Phytophthora fragariae TaxID=53985 RepID=A0A6G0QZP9_9STRA|nr:hypothetical protein PF008_g20454 [Phytophthora fragariae]